MLNTVNFHFPTRTALADAYMPFIEPVGLFLATDHAYELHQIIEGTVTLPEQSETISIEGRVVWITPSNAQDNQVAGVGLQLFGTSTKELQKQIEHYLNLE